MSEWYYAHNNEPLGPISDDLFYQLRTTGTIDPETLVWREGMRDWIPLAQLPQASDPVPSPRPAASVSSPRVSTTGRPKPSETITETKTSEHCSDCGRVFEVDDMVRYEADIICAECKPVYFQRLKECGASPGRMRYGGFWIRAVASLFDGLIMYAVSWPITRLEQWVLAEQVPAGTSGAAAFGLVVALVALLVSSVLQVAYDGFFVGRFAATPGKMIVGLRVVRSDGGRVTYLRAVGRSLASLLSLFTLCIGFLIAAFDREKRTLHDHICDTRVVFK